MTESVASLDAGARTVMCALSEQPALTVGELADRTGLSAAAVRVSVYELGARGLAWRPIVGCEAGRWRLVYEPATS